MQKFECQRCGECCKAAQGILAHDIDVKRWKKEKRYDILEYVDDWEEDRGEGIGYDFLNNEDSKGCVFLKKENNKYKCSIYETRPVPCKQFPYDNEGNIKYEPLSRCKGTEKLKKQGIRIKPTEMQIESFLSVHEDHKPGKNEHEYWKGYWDGVRWGLSKALGEEIKLMFGPPEEK